MGLIADAARRLVVRNNAPPVSPNTGQWTGMGAQTDYLRFGRAYMGNEIVFAAIEMLATSAGEPHIVGRRFRRESPTIRAEARRLAARGIALHDANASMIRNGYFEDLPNHPLIRLLNNPNPFMSRGQMWGTVVMDRALAGNAYLLKARAQSGPLNGTVQELWRLRPDRVKIIPSATDFIKGYEYNTGREKIMFGASDVMHFKTRHPLNDYYGMPPLMAVQGRIDIDEYMKNFLRSFFERGGAGPGSVLSVKQKLSQEQKDGIRDRFRRQFGGAAGFHEMMVIDSNEHTYTPMGLNRGLRDALPKEIDAMQESRIAMVFGIPGSILGLLIGYESSSYANKRQDWQVFWDLTMTPLLSDFDDVLNLQIVPDFGGIDEVLFDLSDIRALQEDVDKIQERHRKNVSVGLESWEEGREAIGLDPDTKNGTFLIPTNIAPISLRRLDEESASGPAAPEPVQIAAPMNAIEDVRHECGKLVARDVQGNPELWCGRCKVTFRPHSKQPMATVKTIERDGEGRIARVLEVVS